MILSTAINLPFIRTPVMNTLPPLPALSDLPALPSLEALQAPSVTTVLQLTSVHVTQLQVVTNLTERQEHVLDQLYETAKLATKEVMNASSMDDAMKIGKMMATIVKLVEKASYRGEKIPGAEKKEIALALGKRLVSDPTVIENDIVRGGVSTAYDLLGESLLETLLDVSRHVNRVIQEAAVSCCESILACIKK